MIFSIDKNKVNFGGKADNLIKMEKIGINIPNFVVISHGVFLEIISKTKWQGLAKVYANDFDIIEFRKFLLDSLVEHEMSLKLRREIEKIKSKKFAVRSSGNLEDSKSHSFAGIFESYLNVESNNLHSKIVECWTSLFHRDAKSYMQTTGISLKEMQMNVVVQEMVDAQYSGVIFTRNPINGKNEILLELVEGLGEDLVAGKVVPMSYVANKEKYNATRLFADRIPKRFDFSEVLLSDLIQKSIEIENIYSFPVDIEFAIENNIVYILQTRPITNL